MLLTVISRVWAILSLSFLVESIVERRRGGGGKGEGGGRRGRGNGKENEGGTSSYVEKGEQIFSFFF